MKRQAGFTMVELLVAVGITGILVASAIPTYRTWQQRAYGSEAAIMVKQILDAEILYYLENDVFYPDLGEPMIDILHGFDPNHDNVEDISDKLNITIPTNHFLDYFFWSDDDDGDGHGEFHLAVSSLHNQFDIVKDVSYIAYRMDKDGYITEIPFP